MTARGGDKNCAESYGKHEITGLYWREYDGGWWD